MLRFERIIRQIFRIERNTETGFAGTGQIASRTTVRKNEKFSAICSTREKMPQAIILPSASTTVVT